VLRAFEERAWKASWRRCHLKGQMKRECTRQQEQSRMYKSTWVRDRFVCVGVYVCACAMRLERLLEVRSSRV